MELKNFVSQALADIVEGVVEAQKLAAQHGALVNPGKLTRSTQAVSTDAVWDNTTNNYARVVSFDVAVSVEEEERAKAKIGVVAGIFNAGANGEMASKERALSRIQFTVPVLFPTQDAGDGARKVRVSALAPR